MILSDRDIRRALDAGRIRIEPMPDLGTSLGSVSMEGGVAFALKPLPNPVEILVGAIGAKTNPRSGKTMVPLSARRPAPSVKTARSNVRVLRGPS